MHHRNAAIAGTLVVALAIGACNRDASQSNSVAPNPEASREVDRTAQLQRDRDEQIASLDKRVADVEHKYTEANQKVVAGKRAPTSGLREEVNEDVANVKRAVTDLRTTTAENWWDRHEAAMKRTADDIEADVRRLAGNISVARPSETTGTTGESVSTAPFTSRRDRLVAELRARLDAMEQGLDKIKTHGARETEVEDTRARLKKMDDDLDRLGSASADDWWDVSKNRVTEYLDRVERSVGRLDDDKS